MSIWRRLKFLIPSFRRAEELETQEELESLQAMAADEHASLGNLTRAAEERRAAWGWTWVEQFVRDVRYAVRTLRKTPAFTATAVLSLALGIGANTAIFTLIDALLLRWLPVPNPQELLMVKLRRRGAPTPGESFSYPMLRALAERKDVFSDAGGFSAETFTVGPRGSMQRIRGAYVSGGFYAAMGLRPAIGRLLNYEDDERGAPAVAVLSYDYWDQQFNRDPNAIGKTLLIEGAPFTIVGVSPPGFVGANVGLVANITLPLASIDVFDPDRGRSLLGPGNVWLRILARAAPGVSVEQARARLALASPGILGAAIPPGLPPSRQKALATSIFDLDKGGTGWTYIRTMYQKPLFVLMAAVSFVLLISCANVANLLLARGSARQHEIAVRLAIGAGRGRIVRQLLTESVLLSLCGAALGSGLAWLASRSLVAMISGGAFPLIFDLTPNWHVLGFATSVAVATGLLFGLMPALQATSGKPSVSLKEDSRMSHSRSRLLFGLVSAEVALCLLLLNGAGLFVRTLNNLEKVDPGFQHEGVLITAVGERRGPARSAADTLLFQESLDRVRSEAGVVSASISNNTPMSGGTWTEAAVPKGQPMPEGDNSHFISIGSRFFETMRMPLIAGREFTQADQGAAPKVAIVNEEFAKRHFAGRNPVGERITATVTRTPVDLEIVGVVKDAIMDGLRTVPPPTVYVSYFERPQLDPAVLEIRASGNLAQISAAIRKDLEPRLPKPLEIYALSDQVAASIVQERMMAMLASAFSILALLLSAVGIYGVLAYTVTRRTNEIGIRMALGAQRHQVLGMVIRDAVRMLAFGALPGLPAAWAVSRWISSMLFGVTPTDPPTMMNAAALLLCVGLAAGFFPARRASRVSAMDALREE